MLIPGYGDFVRYLNAELQLELSLESIGDVRRLAANKARLSFNEVNSLPLTKVVAILKKPAAVDIATLADVQTDDKVRKAELIRRGFVYKSQTDMKKEFDVPGGNAKTWAGEHKMPGKSGISITSAASSGFCPMKMDTLERRTRNQDFREIRQLVADGRYALTVADPR